MFINVSLKSCCLWDNVKKQGTTRGHRWQYSTARALCMLDGKSYKHLIPTAFVRQQQLREWACVTLYVHCLSGYITIFNMLLYIVLYCIVLYCIVLYYIILYYIILYYIILYYIILYYIILYYIILYYIILYYIIYIVCLLHVYVSSTLVAILGEVQYKGYYYKTLWTIAQM